MNKLISTLFKLTKNDRDFLNTIGQGSMSAGLKFLIKIHAERYNRVIDIEQLIRDNELTSIRISRDDNEFIVNAENDNNIHTDHGFDLEETINRTINFLNEK